MLNINTGNLNFSGYFNSVSYYRIVYLDEIYWIAADKSDIWKIFGYIHLNLNLFFTLCSYETAYRNHPSQNEFQFIDNCFNCLVLNYYRH